MKMTLERELRTCNFINDQGKLSNGLFHQWTESTVQGKKKVEAIVETESGEVVKVDPHRIRFTDNKFKEYFWEV